MNTSLKIKETSDSYATIYYYVMTLKISRNMNGCIED
jgi:hypothetical protein